MQAAKQRSQPLKKCYGENGESTQNVVTNVAPESKREQELVPKKANVKETLRQKHGLAKAPTAQFGKNGEPMDNALRHVEAERKNDQELVQTDSRMENAAKEKLPNKKTATKTPAQFGKNGEPMENVLRHVEAESNNDQELVPTDSRLENAAKEKLPNKKTATKTLAQFGKNGEPMDNALRHVEAERKNDQELVQTDSRMENAAKEKLPNKKTATKKPAQYGLHGVNMVPVMLNAVVVAKDELEPVQSKALAEMTPTEKLENATNRPAHHGTHGANGVNALRPVAAEE